MPIYAYKCGSCGHAKDVLQKISDAPLSVCPECGAPAFTKQVTAAGFQLKGTGWYATDFRGGSNAGATKNGDEKNGAEKSGADKNAVEKSGADKNGAEPSGGSKPAEPAKPASDSSSGKSDTPAASASA
jgi:putative FmdB family regulatory protein